MPRGASVLDGASGAVVMVWLGREERRVRRESVERELDAFLVLHPDHQPISLG